MGDWGKTGITYILLSFQSISGSGEQNQRAVVVHHENGNLDGNRSNQPKYKAWLKDPLDGENVSDKLEGRLFDCLLSDDTLDSHKNRNWRVQFMIDPQAAGDEGLVSKALHTGIQCGWAIRSNMSDSKNKQSSGMLPVYRGDRELHTYRAIDEKDYNTRRLYWIFGSGMKSSAQRRRLPLMQQVMVIDAKEKGDSQVWAELRNKILEADERLKKQSSHVSGRVAAPEALDP